MRDRDHACFFAFEDSRPSAENVFDFGSLRHGRAIGPHNLSARVEIKLRQLVERNVAVLVEQDTILFHTFNALVAGGKNRCYNRRTGAWVGRGHSPCSDPRTWIKLC